MSKAVDKEIEQIKRESKIAFVEYLLEGMPWDKNSNSKKGDLKSMWFQLEEEMSGANGLFRIICKSHEKEALQVENNCLLAPALQENDWQKTKETITNYYVKIRIGRDEPITAPRAHCMLDIQIERAWEKFKKDFIKKNKLY